MSLTNRASRLCVVTIVSTIISSISWASAQMSCLTVREAKTLLARTPVFMRMAAKGWRYYYDSETMTPGFNTKDFYFFRVTADTKLHDRPYLAGFYAVNKWTGDVLNVSADEQGVQISSPRLKDYQKLLQQKHGITQEKIMQEKSARSAIVLK